MRMLIPSACLFRFFELGLRTTYLDGLGVIMRESLQAALAAPCGEVRVIISLRLCTHF